MRTICDVCEAAAAILFCPADEAALCQSCDDKVHMCNKLASRHVRVRLAAPSAVARCDICENAPAFFYCEVDGTSLCLQCDMIVHVGGKRTHGRYLILRQKVEFPGDKPGQLEDPASRPLDNGENNEGATNMTRDNQQNHGSSPMPIRDSNGDNNVERDTKMIDLNMKPQRIHEQSSNNQNVQGDNYNVNFPSTTLMRQETWEESGTVQSTPRGPPILSPHLQKQPRTRVHIELGNRPDQDKWQKRWSRDRLQSGNG